MDESLRSEHERRRRVGASASGEAPDLRTAEWSQDSVPEAEPNYETVVPQAARPSSTEGDGERYETLATGAKGDGSAAARVLNLGRPDIPGFEILNELGRGGMGIVYRARQISANRIVALKVVRNDVLDSLPFETRASTLDRFRSEAQAAANLEHDNLVTVFEVGESSGVCYYAMRYVEGRSLFDMLKNGPLEQRLAAAYLEPVARGLHMAHQRGILHRDLKPHNILVDQRTSRPLLADFGLAKFMQKSNEITHAGELLGTPSYMSPEQACDAAHVTASADIYSLGATLYHLVTARPPFQAASLTETIRQIMSQEPVAPRQLNPAIDRDLETICVKCLQKEPARRYESAEALADDLRRYLDGRPIVARPLNWLARTWRWCRRNPVPAAWISIAATFAFVSVVAILVGYVRTAAALDVSRRHLTQTVGAVNELFTRFSEEDLKDEPGMQPLRVELLGRAKEHLHTLLQESAGDPLLRDYVAEARFLVGVAEMENESSRSQAFVELLEASRMQRLLWNEASVDVKRRAARTKALAASLNALGNFRMTDARKAAEEAAQAPQGTAAGEQAWSQVDALCEDVERLYTEARDLRKSLADAEGTSIEYQRLLSSALLNLGICAENRSHFESLRGRDGLSRAQRELALERFHAAQQIRQATRERFFATPGGPQFVKLEQDLGKGDFEIARLLLTDPVGESDALEHLRSAIRHFEQVAQLAPQSLANRHRLGVCHSLLGGRLAQRGELAAAWDSLEQATSFVHPMAMGNPTVSEYQSELAELRLRRGLLKVEQGDLAAAQTELVEACRVLDESLRSMRGGDARPIHPVRLELSRMRFKLAEVQLRMNQRKAALESLALSEVLMQSLIQTGTGDPQFQYELARIALTRGRILSADRDDDAAEKEWMRALEIVTTLLRNDGENVDARLSRARLNRELGALAVRRQAWTAALASLDPARDDLDKLLAEFPGDAEFLREQIATQQALADVRSQMGQGEQAAEIEERVRKLHAELESVERPANAIP